MGDLTRHPAVSTMLTVLSFVICMLTASLQQSPGRSGV